MQQSLPSRIIVFCLPGIGDAILFTPALALLRRAFPKARITIITMFRGTADILGTNPDVDEVRCFDFFNAGWLAGLRYIAGLRREGYELTIMPFPSNRLEYNVVNWFTGAKWRAGHYYCNQSRRNLYFLNNVVTAERGNLHNVEENLRLVQAIVDKFQIVLPDTPAQLKLHLTQEDLDFGRSFLAEHGIGPQVMLFGFHTYSSTFKNMHRKCWDKDNFVQLFNRLGQEHADARFLLFSGPADEEVNQYIMAQVDDRVILVREPNLRRALAVLQHCRVYVGNDSGLMHLAAALDVPVVALFGPTDWRRLHPWSRSYLIVRDDLPCMPCFYYSSRPLQCVANLDYACMRDISVQQVFGAVQTLLAKSHVNPATVSR